MIKLYLAQAPWHSRGLDGPSSEMRVAARLLIGNLAVFGLLTSFAISAAADGKAASTLVNAQMRRNAIRNVERYDWARDRRAALERRVAPYMAMEMETLWRLLPSQEMGRSRDMYSNRSRRPHRKGCPQCYLNNKGADIPQVPSTVDLLKRPWQVQCRGCKTWHPMNDFAAYYESALDETGRFRYGAGDPRYLKPRDGVQGEARKWIDDGLGFEYDGYWWFPAAVYAQAMWFEMFQVAEAFGRLYTMTENGEYARRAAVILDRMADLYPELDHAPHHARGMFNMYDPAEMGMYAMQRSVLGAWAYDSIYDGIREDEELVRFLDRMSREHAGSGKSTFAAVDRHIRENYLVAYIDNIVTSNPVGYLNRGVPQETMAALAVALDDPERTPKYLDWIFAEDGGWLPITLIDHMQRDGFKIQSGINYMMMPGVAMHRLAEVLRMYGRSRHDLYTGYPNFMNSFTMLTRGRVLDMTWPAIGDNMSSMEISRQRLPVPMLVDGYRVYRSEAIAREISLQLNGDLSPVLAQGIYDENPEALVASIQAHLADDRGPLESYNAGGTGLAVLQAPWREHGRAAMINYTRTMSPSHAHADRLSLHLWAFGETLMPDMGRPEQVGGVWPKRHGFICHTISHNTLMVNDTTQGSCYSGKTRLFVDAGTLRVADINGLGAKVEARLGTHQWSQNLYPVETYRRAAVMVDVDEHNSYLLDVFWARGGTNHRLIQNSGSPEANVHGLNMVRQQGGTFAGSDVEFGDIRWDYHGKRATFLDYRGSGFMYLKNVERDTNPAAAFWIDWPIDPRYKKPEGWRAHMRLHNLTGVDEVALAHAEPPRGGHPDKVRYSIRSRFGSNLKSQFVSVIEPYMHEPFITSVALLGRVEKDGEPFAAAVRIELRDGRQDILLIREEAGQFSVGDYRLDGRLGLIRLDADGAVGKLVAIAADELHAGERSVTRSPGAYAGRLVGHDDSDPRNVLLHLDVDVGADVVNQYIIFDNEQIADGSYRIEAVVGERTVNIGQMPIYERLANRSDFSAGVIYNIKPGESFIIPRVAVWEP